MSITAERKQALIKEYATKNGDTGSPEVQVAVLSERIANLTEHFKTHKKERRKSWTVTFLPTKISSGPLRNRWPFPGGK